MTTTRARPGAAQRPRARRTATPASRSSAASRRGSRVTSGCRRLGARGVPGAGGARRQRRPVLRRPVAGAAGAAASTARRRAWRAPRGRASARAGSGGWPTPARRSRWSRSASGWCSPPRRSSAATACVLWAIVLAVLGFGLLWRQADEAQRARWLDQSEQAQPGPRRLRRRRLGGVRPGRGRLRADRRRDGAVRRTPRPRPTGHRRPVLGGARRHRAGDHPRPLGAGG